MAQERLDILHGTLDLFVLRMLATQPRHGWELSRRLRDVTGAQLQVGQGSLYPALRRLEAHEVIVSRWTVSDQNRRVKLYQLTKKGHTQLAIEIEGWRRFSNLVTLVLRDG